MKNYILLALLALLISCNGEGCGSGKQDTGFAPLKEPYGQGLNMQEVIERRGSVLPDICTLIPMFEIAQIIGVPEYDIYVSDNNQRIPEPIHSSCFFKWTDYELPSAGIFMRVERNPYPIEFPNYLTEMIYAKKTTGEKFVDPTIPAIIYSDFIGIGDDGAYNAEDGSYFWRLGNEIAFRIVFNTTHPPRQQYEMAQRLAVVTLQYYLGEK